MYLGENTHLQIVELLQCIASAKIMRVEFAGAEEIAGAAQLTGAEVTC